MTLEKIKQRIQDLLAVAENKGSTQGEIDNAMRFAESLMRKHNLDRSDIKAKSDGSFDVDEVDFHKQSVCMVGVKRTMWQMSLARFIVKRFVGTCDFYYSTRAVRCEPNGDRCDPRMGAVISVYGPKEDVELCVHLFRDMSLRIAHCGKQAFGGFARGDGASYCEGFVNGLAEANRRVEREKLTNKSASPGEQALILADQKLRQQLVVASKNWLTNEVGIKLGSGTGLGGSRTGSSAAYREGVRDGRQTTMGRNRPARLS